MMRFRIGSVGKCLTSAPSFLLWKSIGMTSDQDNNSEKQNDAFLEEEYRKLDTSMKPVFMIIIILLFCFPCGLLLMSMVQEHSLLPFGYFLAFLVPIALCGNSLLERDRKLKELRE